MSITINPEWSQEQKDAVDRINKYNDTYAVLTAEDEYDLIDALVDWFSFLPQLWGPNGDAAKKALHSTLDNVINHKNALEEAMKQLEPENGGGTSPGSEIPDGGGTSPGGTTPDSDLPYDPNKVITPSQSDTPNPKDGHPFDPQSFDPPRRHDPLALDMDRDGEISTVSLADSTAFFDLTGDGIKEKVGWIQANDGLVVYDKNGNGKIDGIGEVFGTPTTSGFAELRALADSNYDGIIDRRDALYSQLKVWQDLNQDGISQANELKSLSEAGVTNINLNGNLLTEAGRYGDSKQYFKSNSTQRKAG